MSPTTKRTARALASAAMLALVVACGPPPPPATSVQRINPNAAVDLSGEWNDTDANQVASVMIRDCLNKPWITRFKQEKGTSKPPVVRLYPMRNRSSEHIATKFFTKQVEMELINSGLVDVVSSSARPRSSASNAPTRRVTPRTRRSSPRARRPAATTRSTAGSSPPTTRRVARRCGPMPSPWSSPTPSPTRRSGSRCTGSRR